MPWRSRIAPDIALPGRHARSEVEPLHRRTRLQGRYRLGARRVTAADDAAHHADRAEMLRQPTCIDALDHRNVVIGEPDAQVALGTPARVILRQLAHND